MTSTATAKARDYYNSEDADTFYADVWGGEDIHIGIYATPDEDIRTASARTVRRIRDSLPALGAASSVIDLGSGYGGAARSLAAEVGCRVTCVNLSQRQNERNRSLTGEAQLSHLVSVVEGNFEQLPVGSATHYIAWSQDALLHSGDKAAVFREVARVLQPGGVFVFTDPMQADDCPEGVLQPVLDRLHLDSMGSVSAYEEMGRAVGLAMQPFEDLTPHMNTHYRRVHEELDRKRDALQTAVSADYIERMKTGLDHWVDAGAGGHLAWGILRFYKP